MDDDEILSPKEMEDRLAEYNFSPPSKKSLYDKFSDWVFRNHLIFNSDTLVGYMEDGDEQAKFLREMGLPDDTEIFLLC